MEIAANGQPKVLSGVAAYLMVNDANAASQFYQEAFAAQEVSRMPAGDGPRLLHVHLYINGASVMLSDPFPEHGHGLEAPAAFSLHLAVTDVEMWWDRAVKAGGVPPMDQATPNGSFRAP